MVGLNSNILNSLHYIMQAAIFGFVLRPGFEPCRYIPGRLAPRLHRKHTKKLAWPGHEARVLRLYCRGTCSPFSEDPRKYARRAHGP